jgi:hypothetical protein
MVVAAGVSLSCVTAVAQIGLQPTVRVDLAELYPQGPAGDGTPVFFRTAQGQLALLPSFDTLAAPFRPLASADEGRTWSNWSGFATWPQMEYADVVRQGNTLLAFCYMDSDEFKGVGLWRSTNEGQTWTGGDRLMQDQDKWAPTNSRVLITSTGRLIVPIMQLLGGEGSGTNRLGTIYSDNNGQSWSRGEMFGPPASLPQTPEGFSEPAVVELADGKMWMAFRSRYGHLWQAWSSDGGATWGDPIATTLISPISSLNAKRIPGTNAVIALWNNSPPGASTDWNTYPNLWSPRSPLVYAISQDNCQTWSDPVTICTGTAVYPSVYFSETEMFVSYWADPDPNLLWGSHLEVVAYDIPSLLHIPEPSASVLGATGMFGVAMYIWRRRKRTGLISSGMHCPHT